MSWVCSTWGHIEMYSIRCLNKSDFIQVTSACPSVAGFKVEQTSRFISIRNAFSGWANDISDEFPTSLKWLKFNRRWVNTAANCLIAVCLSHACWLATFKTISLFSLLMRTLHPWLLEMKVSCCFVSLSGQKPIIERKFLILNQLNRFDETIWLDWIVILIDEDEPLRKGKSHFRKFHSFRRILRTFKVTFTDFSRFHSKSERSLPLSSD